MKTIALLLLTLGCAASAALSGPRGHLMDSVLPEKLGGPPYYTEPATPTATPAPTIVVPIDSIPRGMTADEFEAKALRWLSVLGTVGAAAIGILAMLWSRIVDIKARMDRQSKKTGSLETRLTAVAMATPQGAEALRNAPGDPQPPEPPGYGPSRLAIAIASLSTAAAFGFAACATDTGDPETDARGRATNQALTEAAYVLGNIATATLFNAASGELRGSNAEFGQAAAEGLWVNVNAASTSAAVKRVVAAYGAGKTPATATAAAETFAVVKAETSEHTTAEIVDAIAVVVSTAAGAPPR